MAKCLLDEAVRDYYLFRKSQGAKANTLSNVKSHTVAFLTKTGNIYVENVAERHVTDYLTFKSSTCSSNTIGRHIDTLNGFFDWCKRTRRMPPRNDPMAGRKAPERVKRERARVHISKLPALLDAAEARDPRDRAFIALAFYTLSRASEITGLRLGDVDLEAGYLHVRVWKSNTEDRLAIPTELDRELRRWMTAYANAVECGRPDHYLIPSRKLATRPGQPTHLAPTVYLPTRRVVHTETIVKPALEGIGFVVPGQSDLRGEGSHTLRRSAARALFDRLVGEGYDHALRVVAAQMHHKSTMMTEEYIGVSADRYTRDALLRGRPMFDLPAITTLSSKRGLAAGDGAHV